jgi:catechol 2,3-dioxygenase-like lactoylglutathione lyase family enzyme
MSGASVNALLAVEIGVPVLDAAVSFYEDIWWFSPVARSDDSHYFRASAPNYYVLALHRRPAPCFVRVRLGAKNRQTVDALAGKAKRAEGRLLNMPGALSIPGEGYGFAFLDPEGREFQVLCDAQIHSVAPTDDRPCRLSHVVLSSLDFDRVSSFLHGALGFRLRDRTAKVAFMGCGADHHSVAVTNRSYSLSKPRCLRAS